MIKLSQSIQALDRPGPAGPRAVIDPGLQSAGPRAGRTRPMPRAGEKGRPLDGYLATITLMLLALFLVGKSARR